MSVLACNRKGCENVLCDRYSPHYGYICYPCFEELVDSGPTTDIPIFMSTPASNNQHTEVESRARYEAAFEVSYDDS